VRGTFNVLEAARSNGEIKQLLFASTDALFEKYPPQGMQDPITEAMPRSPQGWYALSKSMGEEMCNSYWRGYGLPITILRFAMVCGAGEILDFSQFYLSKLRTTYGELEPLWKGEEQLVLLRDSKGRYFKKHIADVRDIVHGCLCALGRERALGETFQLAGPRPFTWDEAVYRLAEILDLPLVDIQVSGTPTFYEFDLSKAQTALGFQPSCDIVRMIVDALSFRRGEDIGVLLTG
ncbi:MAG: hypothetical protein CME16_02295, partial [Gemmatimonadetes bacterium]|nr:hypothetical protein [Gemmatimonadota bacterium]